MLALFEAEFPPQQAGRALERLASEWEVDAAVAEHARAIVGVTAHARALDAEIATRAPRIPVAELGRIERTILRSALFEVLYSAAFPSAGTIRDAVSLARTYAGEAAARLVGGVLRGAARLESEGDEG
jgi:N utilization substance protein B